MTAKQRRPLVFLDTETTGLGVDDDIWEIALVRRETDGSQTTFHAFVEHRTSRCRRLPEPFLGDHQARFPLNGVGALPRAAAMLAVYDLTKDRPYIVGAVPGFDTERLASHMRGALGLEPRWHHRLRCVEAMALGYTGEEVGGGLATVCQALSIPTDPAARHTATGDVNMVMAVYDRLVGPGRSA